MWLYIGILGAAATALLWHKTLSQRKNLVTWTRQVFANQISRYLVDVHGTHYIVHYPLGVTWYKIVIPRRRGPSQIDTIITEDGVNVKKQVAAFLGPGYNFHGQTVTPKIMGYDILTFTRLDGTSVTFNSDEKIEI